MVDKFGWKLEVVLRPDDTAVVMVRLTFCKIMLNTYFD